MTTYDCSWRLDIEVSLSICDNSIDTKPFKYY